MKILRLCVVVALIVSMQAAFLPMNFAENKHKDDEHMFDFTAPPATNIRLLEHLYFGLQPKVEYKKEDNFDLDDSSAENETTMETSLSLAMLYQPQDKWKLFLNVRPAYLDMDDQDNKKHSDTKFELVQGYLMFTDVWGDSELVAGRQRFIDERQWLYDEEMDGLRYTQFFEKIALEFSVFKKNRMDLLSKTRNQKIINFMAQGHLAFNKENTGNIFIFNRNDYSSGNDDFTLVGTQFEGRLKKRWRYWLNAGIVTGTMIDKDILGFGADAGLTYVFDARLKPSVTVGYAYGSGDDDPNDGKDTNFRQTGFQDNSAKLNGVVDVKTYGELFDPELSNLSIATLGIGFWPTKSLSVDCLYHYFRQNESSTSIRDSQLNQDPNGRDKRLGDEVDLVFGFKVHKQIKLSVVVGYFRPKKAFGPDADSAQFINAEMKINF